MKGWTRRDLFRAALAAGGATALAWGRAMAQSPSAAALLAAPRRALVIGNSRYGFAPLKNPANDARALADELRRVGFEVTSGIDLARRDMEEAIRAYADGLARGKPVGLFYFAGHGVQFAWRNYLLPTDAQAGSMADVQKSCVDVNALIEGVARAANPMNMIILAKAGRERTRASRSARSRARRGTRPTRCAGRSPASTWCATRRRSARRTAASSSSTGSASCRAGSPGWLP